MQIALLGAECTGKTQLTQALVQALSVGNDTAFAVPEVLRTWCAQNGRTPQRHEQAFIAKAQAQQQAQTQAQVRSAVPDSVQMFVLADTTALMTAVYSDLLFQDTSLYPFALAQQRPFDITLVMGLDLPWVADGLQRDGALMRVKVDARLRQVLDMHGVKYTVIYGTGQNRTDSALQTIAHHRGSSENCPPAKPSSWRWSCEKCSDADCEHQLFSALIKNTSVRD